MGELGLQENYLLPGTCQRQLTSAQIRAHVREQMETFRFRQAERDRRRKSRRRAMKAKRPEQEGLWLSA